MILCLCFFSLSSHVPVDSNETLYGGDTKFLSELNKLCETLIGQILDHLKTLGRDEVGTNAVFLFLLSFFILFSTTHSCIDDVLVRSQQSTRRQGALAFSLFGVLLTHGDLRNNKLSQLAVNLWNLSHKHGYCDTRTSVSFLYFTFSATSASFR